MQAEADGLPVREAAEPGGGLDGVADGVAEVEHGAQARLLLVALHDPGLVLDGAGDQLLGHGAGRERRARQQPHAAQHGAPGEQAVLGDLGGAAAELARRQRVERAQVRQHQARLVERADVVLAGAEVHGDLAADGRVHLGEQRRRHLHEADAALVGGRHEPGQVADHAAAEGDQRVAAPQPAVVQHAVELLGAGEVLLPLARRQDDLRGAQVGRQQAPARPVEVQRRHVLVAEHDDLSLAAQLAHGGAQLLEDATAHQDRIRARRGVHRQALHRAPPSARLRATSVTSDSSDAISAAMSRGDRASTSTIAVATSRYRGSRPASKAPNEASSVARGLSASPTARTRSHSTPAGAASQTTCGRRASAARTSSLSTAPPPSASTQGRSQSLGAGRGDDLRLQSAKRGLSAVREDDVDRAGLRDDEVVGVDEGDAERRRQLAPDGALARRP